MRRVMGLIGAVCLLGACTGNEARWMWAREVPVSEEEKLTSAKENNSLEQELAECKKYQRTMHGAEHVEEGRFSECMALKGWSLVDNTP